MDKMDKKNNNNSFIFLALPFMDNKKIIDQKFHVILCK